MRISRTFLEEHRLPDGLEAGETGLLPVKALQFGEGNFLRAFVDWMIDGANRQGLFNGSVAVVQPIERGLIDELNAQDGLYTLLLRGISGGERVDSRQIVTALSCGVNPYRDWQAFLDCAGLPELRVVVSNTTEAGIAYAEEPRPVFSCPASFPAKAAALLHERFERFGGDGGRGFIFLPCELIEDNGKKLKQIILRHARHWGLGQAFETWVDQSCIFLDTLVDRIVPGYPREEAAELHEWLGYEDKLLDAGEIFHLLVIRGDEALESELPFKAAGFNVVWTDDIGPYRERKVKLLNGAHTMTALAAYLCGAETVRECVEHPVIGRFLRQGIFGEICPSLPLPQEEKTAYADSVLERFSNPFIRHELLSIALNSVSKYRVRNLPTLLAHHERTGALPKALTFGLAALLAFYRGTPSVDGLVGEAGGRVYTIRDEAPVLEFFAGAWAQVADGMPVDALAAAALGRADFWGRDLREVPGLKRTVSAGLSDILENGCLAAMRRVLE